MRSPMPLWMISVSITRIPALPKKSFVLQRRHASSARARLRMRSARRNYWSMGIVLICMHLVTVLILEKRSKKELMKLSGQLYARYITFQIGQTYFHMKALPKLWIDQFFFLIKHCIITVIMCTLWRTRVPGLVGDTGVTRAVPCTISCQKDDSSSGSVAQEYNWKTRRWTNFIMIDFIMIDIQLK